MKVGAEEQEAENDQRPRRNSKPRDWCGTSMLDVQKDPQKSSNSGDGHEVAFTEDYAEALPVSRTVRRPEPLNLTTNTVTLS